MLHVLLGAYALDFKNLAETDPVTTSFTGDLVVTDAASLMTDLDTLWVLIRVILVFCNSVVPALR